MTLDTDQVLTIAGEIEVLNKNLNDLLNESRATIDSLSSIWQGKAATATIDSYRTFSEKYFQEYDKIINQYILFLRQNVSEGYNQAESINEKLADAFK